jgi:hypothetical protein
LISPKVEIPLEYEKELVLYEIEIRNNVKVQHQLKLHVDLLKEKLELNTKEHANKLIEKEIKTKELV